MHAALLERAIAIAVQAHHGAVDKSGQPYILHPLRVMFALPTVEEQIVGVLHDVLEDTVVTVEELRKEGFPEPLLTALLAVTKQKGERYEDYIQRAKANPIGRAVKRADLCDNMDIRRLGVHLSAKDHERLQRYLLAWESLRDG